MSAKTKKDPKYDYGFAIVRIDIYKTKELENIFKIKKIVWSHNEAILEVDRLNKLNQDKKCKYFCQIAKMERKKMTIIILSSIVFIITLFILCNKQ